MSDADIVRDTLVELGSGEFALAALARMAEREKLLVEDIITERAEAERVLGGEYNDPAVAHENYLKHKLAEADANGLRLAEENEQLRRAFESDEAAIEQAGEVARLKAEVERLKVEHDHWAKEATCLTLKVEQLEAESKRNYDIAVKAQAQLFEQEAEVGRLRTVLERIGRIGGVQGEIARQALEGSTSETQDN